MVRATVVPINIGCSGGCTLQEEIYTSIRKSITDGSLAVARRLPSTRALARELGVSRTTVLLAIEHLQAEGYLVSRRGSGIFVSKDLPDCSPQVSPTTRSAPAHPAFSARGRALAQARTPDRRRLEPARAFRLGTPGLDLFPVRLWTKIVRKCAGEIDTSRLDYSARRGLPALREAIAEQVRSRGTRCDPRQIAVTGGGQRALDLIFHLLLDPGDSVWMEDPGYPGAVSALMAAGARLRPAPVDHEGLDVECLVKSPLDIRLSFVTPSHQFPLGVPMSLSRRRSLLAWASRSNAWIVEDDYDCDFRYQIRPLPCLHALDPDGRVIYVGSFSKTLFPALRMGFLIVPNDLASGVAAARLASDVHPPTLEQAVLAEFMARGHYQRHLRRMREAYLERLDALQRAIRDSGVPLRLRPVHTGLHAIADLDGVDAECVYREAALRGVEVMPLSHYYLDGGTAHNALVLGFAAVRPAAIRAGLSRLALAIDAARRQRCASTPRSA